MLNTYGIRSVNAGTFNTSYQDNLYFPRNVRNVVVTALRINNALLNVMGYIPEVSRISGCVRMAIGLGIIAVTLAIGDRHAPEGAIIGRWYDEAIATGAAQVARGALEALVPSGWKANLALDVIATPLNLSKEIAAKKEANRLVIDDVGVRAGPHEDADYSFPFMLLHLV